MKTKERFSNPFIRKVSYSISYLPYFVGKGKILKLLDMLILKPNGKLNLKFHDLFTLEINPKEDKGVEEKLFYRGCYEVGTLNFIKLFCNKLDYFIDIGANIGLMSIYFNKIHNKPVYSFEANPETFKILNDNIELNNIENIKTFNMGIGDKQDKLKFFPNININRGGASFINRSNNEDKFYEVELNSVDNLNNIFPSQGNSLIKIDVEGWELNVLNGSLNYIKKHKPIIIIENSKELSNSKKNSLSIFNFLSQLNIYEIFVLSRSKENLGKLNKIKNEDELPNHDNLFCLPKIEDEIS